MASVAAVVLDLDGTLVDSRQDIVRAVHFALDRHGVRQRELNEIASYVGDGARMLVARALDLRPTDGEVDPVLDTFLRYYSEHAADCTTPMPGAIAALDALRHLPLALCTNKPRPATELVIERLRLGRHFALVLAAGDLPYGKPHPAPLVHVAKTLRIPTTRMVMVGDGVQDIECGHRAGAHTIAVLGGFTSKAQLMAARPHRILSTIAELPAAALSL